ncbi:MAG: molybdopterin oxidoreductase family protein [Nitrospiria bacterium]
MDWSRRDILKLLGLGTANLAGLSSLSLSGCTKNRKPALADTWRKGVCRFCGTGCGVMVGLRDGKVIEVKGDELAHNRGMLCVKGSLLPEILKLPGRLLHPMIRKSGVLQQVTWDEAMHLITRSFESNLRDHGPESLAYYGSGQLFTEESYTANKLFKAGLRSNNVDGNPRLCMASAAFGYVQTFGKDEPMGCYEDIEHAACYFVIGANPYECHPVLFERILLRKRQNPKVKLIVVDPRRTESAGYADHFIQPIPGTDLLLLNAMAHVIVEDGLIDTAFIDAHCRFMAKDGPVDLAGYRAFLQDYAPEKVAGEMGVAPAQIREIAYIFAQSKATLSLWTMGINQRTQGVFLNNTLHNLHLITGQICRPGATPLSLTGQGNACGGVRDTGSLAHLLPGGRLIKKPEHRKAVEQLWKVPPGTISPKPGYHAMELFKAMGDGRVRAALIMGSNPMQTLPNLTAFKEKVKTCFIAVAEPFADAKTLEIADVVLPAALWVEKEGVYGQTERRYQILEKLVEPQGEARSDLDILVDLAKRLKLDHIISAHTPAAVWDEWRRFSESSKYNFKGMTYERLKKERGLQWPCPSETHPGTKRRFVGGDDPFVSPGKKVEFYGKADKRAVIYLRTYHPSPQRPSKDYPLLLTTGRVLEQWHTGTITDKVKELSLASGRGRLEMNRQDAHRYGIASGDQVKVVSEFGELQLKALVSDSPRAGVTFAPFFDAKRLINHVVSPYYDTASKQPEFKVTAVRIEKI